jgi:uncharacterized protein (TIRG00374 family)
VRCSLLLVPQTRNSWVAALRLLIFGGAGALLIAVISAADLTRVAELVGAIGLAGLAVVLLPQALAFVADSFGWKLAIRTLGENVRLLSLLRVRIGTEALTQSLPAGVMVGESVKPFLLGRHCGLPVNVSIAAIVARKFLLLVSQATYVLVVAVFGFTVLRDASLGVFGRAGLEWVAVGSGVVLAILALGVAAWLRRSAVAEGLFWVLKKLPFSALSRWLEAKERRFSEADHAVSSFFSRGLSSHAQASLFFVLVWLIESLETWLILRILGVNVGLVEIASLEIVLTLVRHVVFVVPAGLGVQDFGYVAGLAALGVPDASSVGAAFVLVKRTKELFWIALGYGLLAGEGRSGASSARSASRVRTPGHGAPRPAIIGTSSA